MTNIYPNNGTPSSRATCHKSNELYQGDFADFGGDLGSFDNGSPLQLDQESCQPGFVTNRPFTLYNYGRAPFRESKRPSKDNRADYIATGQRESSNMAKTSKTVPEPRPPSSRTTRGQSRRYNNENCADNGHPETDRAQEALDVEPTEGNTPQQSNEKMKKDLEECRVQDKTLKKEDMLVLVGTLRKSLYVRNKKTLALEANRDALQKNIANLKRKVEELEADNQELEERNKELEENPTASDSEIQVKLRNAEKALAAAKAEYLKLSATSSAKIKKLERKLENALMSATSKPTKINEQFLKILAEKVKTIGWGKIKFIQNHHEQTIAAKIMWKHGELVNIFAENKEITRELKMEFVKTYSDFIRGYIFEKRSYATAEVKKWYMAQWTKKKPTLSLEDLKKCLARRITNEDEMAMFMIYWDELLAKHIGSSKWKDATKYYNTISGAMRNDCETTLPLITPYDEAFLVLSTENHLQRWETEFQNIGKPPTTDENGQPSTTSTEKKDHSGLYTSTTNGQNQYGGWNEKGLELFNTYVDMNVAARKQDNCLEVEKQCLQMLRNREGIEANNAEEHNKAKLRQKSAKKRGNQNAPMPPAKKIVRTLVDVDSSDDENEEEDGRDFTGV